MEKKLQMNTLLALNDKGRNEWKNAIDDLNRKFVKNQGLFQGERKTYTNKSDGKVDDDKSKTAIVASTVREQLDWLIDNQSATLKNIFSAEATNASSGRKVELIVRGRSYGLLSSLELLRLKSLLESGDLGKLRELITNIPTRAENVRWEKSQDENFTGREVYENAPITSIDRTTEVNERILEDPNIGKLKDATGYKPHVSSTRVTIELGEINFQKFSGEMSQHQRAKIMALHSDMLDAVIIALKEVNETPVIETEFKVQEFLTDLFSGE